MEKDTLIRNILTAYANGENDADESIELLDAAYDEVYG